MSRLIADFWVHAHIAVLRTHNIAAYVIRRGDNTSGAVLVRINFLDGQSQVYAQSHDTQGNRGWRALGAKQEDEAIDATINKQVSYDPDIWILEIEDKEGRHFLDPVLE